MLNGKNNEGEGEKHYEVILCRIVRMGLVEKASSEQSLAAVGHESGIYLGTFSVG